MCMCLVVDWRLVLGDRFDGVPQYGSIGRLCAWVNWGANGVVSRGASLCKSALYSGIYGIVEITQRRVRHQQQQQPSVYRICAGRLASGIEEEEEEEEKLCEKNANFYTTALPHMTHTSSIA